MYKDVKEAKKKEKEKEKRGSILHFVGMLQVHLSPWREESLQINTNLFCLITFSLR